MAIGQEMYECYAEVQYIIYHPSGVIYSVLSFFFFFCQLDVQLCSTWLRTVSVSTANSRPRVRNSSAECQRQVGCICRASLSVDLSKGVSVFLVFF
jgi:hypothetical protein